MSWQITEVNEVLKFSRFLPDSKLWIEISLDHSAGSHNIFDGEVMGENNTLLASCSGPTFLGVFDQLLQKGLNGEKEI